MDLRAVWPQSSSSSEVCPVRVAWGLPECSSSYCLDHCEGMLGRLQESMQRTVSSSLKHGLEQCQEPGVRPTAVSE